MKRFMFIVGTVLAVVLMPTILSAIPAGQVADAAQTAGLTTSNLSAYPSQTLPAADNDLATAVNDVLANDSEALAFNQSVLAAESSSNPNSADTGQIPCFTGPGGITTGHFTVTPSGNVVLVCHSQAPLGPPQAIVIQGLPCGVPAPGGGFAITTDSHFVWTPSGRVNLVCHLHS